jgi:hypothetical protein
MNDEIIETVELMTKGKIVVWKGKKEAKCVVIAAPLSKNRARQALNRIELGRGEITISSLCAGTCR